MGKTIKEMIDDVQEEFRKLFPENTRASITMDADGYVNFQITRWENINSGDSKYKHLLHLYKINGEWGKDESEAFNNHLKEIGKYWEE